MKKLTLILMLGTLSLGATAQTAPDTSTVTISGTDQAIVLPSKYRKMWPDDFSNYKGAYNLSNGQSLSVFSRGTRMYAKVEDQNDHELVAIAPNTFVALDEKLKMTINLHDDGNVSGELLMKITPDHVASGSGTGEQLLVATFR